jgi:hypothetical protein
MGYACPVCEVPQRDGEHLANHLAFTAMLREDDHEDWLDEHVPGWGGETPADLAARVTDHAEEADYDEVFEDTTGGGHDHHADHGHAHGGGQDPLAGQDPTGGLGGMAQGVTDAAVESVLEEAREMTTEMYGLDGDADGDATTEGNPTDDGETDAADGADDEEADEDDPSR